MSALDRRRPHGDTDTIDDLIRQIMAFQAGELSPFELSPEEVDSLNYYRLSENEGEGGISSRIASLDSDYQMWSNLSVIPEGSNEGSTLGSRRLLSISSRSQESNPRQLSPDYSGPASRRPSGSTFMTSRSLVIGYRPDSNDLFQPTMVSDIAERPQMRAPSDWRERQEEINTFVSDARTSSSSYNDPFHLELPHFSPAPTAPPRTALPPTPEHTSVSDWHDDMPTHHRMPSSRSASDYADRLRRGRGIAFIDSVLEEEPSSEVEEEEEEDEFDEYHAFQREVSLSPTIKSPSTDSTKSRGLGFTGFSKLRRKASETFGKLNSEAASETFVPPSGRKHVVRPRASSAASSRVDRPMSMSEQPRRQTISHGTRSRSNASRGGSIPSTTSSGSSGGRIVTAMEEGPLLRNATYGEGSEGSQERIRRRPWPYQKGDPRWKGKGTDLDRTR